MKTLVTVVLAGMLAAVCVAADVGVKVGDSREQAVQVLGKPIAVMKSGGREIMQYQAGAIEVEGGVVVVVQGSPHLAPPKPVDTNAPPKAASKSWFKKADASPADAAQAAPGAAAPSAPAPSGGPSGLAKFLDGITSKFKGMNPSAAAAKEVYLKFAEHMAFNRYQDAKPLATGTALAFVEGFLKPIPKIGRTGSMVDVLKQMNSAQYAQKYAREMTDQLAPVMSTTYNIESVQVVDNDTRVIMTVKYTLVRGMTGGALARSKDPYRHYVEVMKVNGEWKVSSYVEEHLPKDK